MDDSEDPRDRCSKCGALWRVPEFPPGVMGSFMLGCDCPPPPTPTRQEKKQRKRMPRHTLSAALDILISVLSDGKLSDWHVDQAEDLGIWKR